MIKAPSHASEWKGNKHLLPRATCQPLHGGGERRGFTAVSQRGEAHTGSQSRRLVEPGFIPSAPPPSLCPLHPPIAQLHHAVRPCLPGPLLSWASFPVLSFSDPQNSAVGGGSPWEGRRAGCFQLEGLMREEAVTENEPPALLSDHGCWTLSKFFNFFGPQLPPL